MLVVNTKSNTGEQSLAAADYITKKEIAERLRKTPRTIELWMKRGYLPFLKIGRSVTFHWPTVQAHLNAHYCIEGRGQ